jgi:CRP/FNR family transcriptional regulator, cyclic AMP receptor protein
MDPQRLTAISVFSDLSPEEARRLAAFAVETSIAVGDTVIRQGDFSTELFAIEEGTADVIQDGVKLRALGPGDLVGEIGVLSHGMRPAGVVATSPMLVLKLTHWELRRMPVQTLKRIQELMEQRLHRLHARERSERP